MAVYKFSNVGGFGTYQRYNDFLAGNPVVQLDKGSMFPLGVFTLSSDSASAIFDNIPSTYKHLHIRCLYKTSRASSSVGAAYLTIRANGDTAGNYSFHRLYGEGTNAFSDGATANATYFNGGNMIGNTSTTSVFHAAVIDILDYSSTNKYKTMRSLNGADNNGSGNIALFSSSWRNSNAITSLTFGADAGTYNLLSGSTFALYGINA